MSDYIEIGASPSGESCAQVGDPNYAEKSRIECKLFRELLEETFGAPPPGGYLAIKSFPHEFGSYREVVAVYDENREESVEWASKLESETPESWPPHYKERLLKELADAGFSSIESETPIKAPSGLTHLPERESKMKLSAFKKTATSEEIRPRERRDRATAEQLAHNRTLGHGYQPSVVLQHAFDDSPQNEAGETRSIFDPIRIAEIIIRRLYAKEYQNVQEAFNGITNPKCEAFGRWASKEQKVRLANILASYGYIVDYDPEKDGKKKKNGNGTKKEASLEVGAETTGHWDKVTGRDEWVIHKDVTGFGIVGSVGIKGGKCYWYVYSTEEPEEKIASGEKDGVTEAMNEVEELVELYKSKMARQVESQTQCSCSDPRCPVHAGESECDHRGELKSKSGWLCVDCASGGPRAKVFAVKEAQSTEQDLDADWKDPDRAELENVILKRDGKTLGYFKGVNEALKALQDMVPYSWDHAIKHEGYSIEDMVGNSLVKPYSSGLKTEAREECDICGEPHNSEEHGDPSTVLQPSSHSLEEFQDIVLDEAESYGVDVSDLRKDAEDLEKETGSPLPDDDSIVMDAINRLTDKGYHVYYQEDNFLVYSPGKVVSDEGEGQKKEAAGKPPKDWWDKHYDEVKKGNPSYSDEQISKTVGKIWSDMSEGQKEKKSVKVTAQDDTPHEHSAKCKVCKADCPCEDVSCKQSAGHECVCPKCKETKAANKYLCPKCKSANVKKDVKFGEKQALVDKWVCTDHRCGYEGEEKEFTVKAEKKSFIQRLFGK